MNRSKLIAGLITSLMFLWGSNVLQTSSTSIGMPVLHFLVVLTLLAVYIAWEKQHGVGARLTAGMTAFGVGFGFFVAALLMAFNYRINLVMTLACLAALQVGIYQIVAIVVDFISKKMAKAGS